MVIDLVVYVFSKQMYCYHLQISGPDETVFFCQHCRTESSKHKPFCTCEDKWGPKPLWLHKTTVMYCILHR